ncbi:MAG: hypothetical protein RR549_00670 [Oscillospiraceae bacterium]
MISGDEILKYKSQNKNKNKSNNNKENGIIKYSLTVKNEDAV